MLVLGAVVAGCGDPNGPPVRGRGVARATVVEPAAEVAPSSTTALVAATSVAVDAPARPFERLRTASLEEVVMTLRADPDADARRHAADVYVQRLGQGVSPEPLLEACATDLDPLVRRWAALGLAASPAPDLAPRLRALEGSEPDATVRSILGRAAREAERQEVRR